MVEIDQYDVYEANLLETQEWCEEKYKNKKIYERKLPRKIERIKAAKAGEEETEEQRETRLAIFFNGFRKNEIYIKGKAGEKLTEDEQRLYNLARKIEKEYEISTQEANLLEAQEWCEEKYKDKKLYERKLPRRLKDVKSVEKGEQETEEQREMRLARSIEAFKGTNIYKRAQNGEKLTQEETRIYGIYTNIQDNYNINTNKANLLEIKDWCEEKYKDAKRYEKSIPRLIQGIKVAKEGEQETEEQREVRLATAWSNYKKREIYQKANANEELTEEEQQIHKLYEEIKEEYDVSGQEANLLKIKEWCEEKFKDAKIYEKRIPRQIKIAETKGEKDIETPEQIEGRLGTAWSGFKNKSEIYKKGEAGEELTEEEERIYSLYKEIEQEYNTNPNEANLLETQEWCEENFKDKPREERRFPRCNIENVVAAKEGEQETEGQRERRLGIGLRGFRQSAIYENGENGEKLTEEDERIYNLYKKLEKEYASESQLLLSKQIRKRVAEKERDESKQLCEQYEELLENSNDNQNQEDNSEVEQ